MLLEQKAGGIPLDSARANVYESSKKSKERRYYSISRNESVIISSMNSENMPVEDRYTESVQAKCRNPEAVQPEDRFFTYMLRCGDGSLYTGYTDDLEKRLKKHASGEGAKYTRAHLPVELAYYEAFATKSEAMKREAAIKKLSKARKEEMVRDFGSGTEALVKPARSGKQSAACRTE